MNEANKPKTLFQASLYYGVLMAVISIIFSLVSGLIPDETKQSMGVLLGTLSIIISLGISIYILYAGITARKKEQDGFITFGDGVKISFFIGLVNGIISSIWNVLYIYLIDPSVMKNAMNQARLQFEKQDLSEEQIEMQMKMMEFFFSPYFTLPVGLLFSIIFTVIIGLIVAAILKKDKEHPF